METFIFLSDLCGYVSVNILVLVQIISLFDQPNTCTLWSSLTCFQYHPRRLNTCDERHIYTQHSWKPGGRETKKKRRIEKQKTKNKKKQKKKKTSHLYSLYVGAPLPFVDTSVRSSLHLCVFASKGRVLLVQHHGNMSWSFLYMLTREQSLYVSPWLLAPKQAKIDFTVWYISQCSASHYHLLTSHGIGTYTWSSLQE